MPKDEDAKARKRMVVEEVGVGDRPKTEPEPQISEEAASTEEPAVEKEVPEKPKEEHKIEPEKVPEPSPQKPPSIALWIIIPGFFLLGALLGGIFFYQKGISSGTTPTPAPIETPALSETTTPSPTAEPNLGKYTIKILNGSGISGEAGKVKSLLEKAGFKVSSAGNASSFDYTKTVIQAKEDVDKDFLLTLSRALSETYGVDSKTQSLSASSTDQVVVLVGSSKN